MSGSRDLKSPSIDEAVKRVLPKFAKLEQQSSFGLKNYSSAINDQLNYSDELMFPLKTKNQKQARLTFLDQFVSYSKGEFPVTGREHFAK